MIVSVTVVRHRRNTSRNRRDIYGDRVIPMVYAGKSQGLSVFSGVWRLEPDQDKLELTSLFERMPRALQQILLTHQCLSQRQPSPVQPTFEV